MEYQIIKFHLVANLTTIAGKSCEGEINSKIVKSFYDQCCEYIGKCKFFFERDDIYIYCEDIIGDMGAVFQKKT